jgi:hypothetical protein
MALGQQLSLASAFQYTRTHTIWWQYILAVLCLGLARVVYLRFLHPYRDIPGPFLAAVSPLWKVRSALKGSIHRDIMEGHRKYGKIFRIAPDEVSISDPEAIKAIYAHGSGFAKVAPSGVWRLMF